jgi:hypothetical protein
MKDSRQKYVDISIAFNNRATELDLFCKQSQRICERVAKRLATERPKTPLEFERQEYLKEFVLKTSQTNERTIELLGYVKGFLEDILEDSKVLIDGAILRDKLKFQSATIEILMNQSDVEMQRIYTEKKNEILSGNTANPK